MIKLLEKKKITTHQSNRAPITTCVSYIHPTKPFLMRRTGWEVANDVQDDYTDWISRDNGKSWGESTPAPSAIPVEGGHIVHTEHVVCHVPDRNLLVVMTIRQPCYGMD